MRPPICDSVLKRMNCNSCQIVFNGQKEKCRKQRDPKTDYASW